MIITLSLLGLSPPWISSCPDCVICWENPPDILCMPCRHRIICANCRSKFDLRDKPCPVCRSNIIYFISESKILRKRRFFQLLKKVTRKDTRRFRQRRNFPFIPLSFLVFLRIILYFRGIGNSFDLDRMCVLIDAENASLPEDIDEVLRRAQFHYRHEAITETCQNHYHEWCSDLTNRVKDGSNFEFLHMESCEFRNSYMFDYKAVGTDDSGKKIFWEFKRTFGLTYLRTDNHVDMN